MEKIWLIILKLSLLPLLMWRTDYFFIVDMSGVQLDQASGVPDWSTVHKPVGDLFEHVNLVGTAAVSRVKLYGCASVLFHCFFLGDFFFSCLDNIAP